MFGMIGKISTTAETRDELIALLLEGSNNMPGCLSYVVAKDAEDPAAIWVTEAWRSKADHTASLELDSVKAAIAKARPLITGFDVIATTEPVGGKGV